MDEPIVHPFSGYYGDSMSSSLTHPHPSPVNSLQFFVSHPQVPPSVNYYAGEVGGTKQVSKPHTSK